MSASFTASTTRARSAVEGPDKELLDFREHGTNTITDDEIDAPFAHKGAHTDKAMGDDILHAPFPTEDVFEACITDCCCIVILSQGSVFENENERM